MINTTLCYIRRGEECLMLYRNKKENDENRDKWIGIGGKFEYGESPFDCARREIKEETGLTIKNPKLCGIKEFHKLKDGKRYIVFLYTANEFSGELKSSDEGEMFWYPLSKLPESENLIDGFGEMLSVFVNENISEVFYERTDEVFKTVYY